MADSRRWCKDGELLLLLMMIAPRLSENVVWAKGLVDKRWSVHVLVERVQVSRHLFSISAGQVCFKI